MCRSVPQMPVFSTRILTSLMPTAGSETSSIHNPRSALLFTNAFTSTASHGAALFRLRLGRIPVQSTASSPHEVEARRLIEEFAGVGEEVAGVVGEGREQAFPLCGRTGDGRLTLDADISRGVDEDVAEAADLVDQGEVG